MSAALAAACVLLSALALRELWAERGERIRVRLLRGFRRLGSRLDRGALGGGDGDRWRRRRLRGAGLERRLHPRTLAAARPLAALAALGPALALAPAAPGRTQILVAVAVPLGAAFGPDLLLDWLARSRQRRIADSLPDALDLMAIGAGSGRSGSALLTDAARVSEGPLGEELAAAVAALQCGRPLSTVLDDLGRDRGDALAAAAAMLERSRRLGSPLARELHRQAASLRAERARRIGESAARAAPKIQLVVALLLVPSVLLIVAAAILANADTLFSGL